MSFLVVLKCEKKKFPKNSPVTRAKNETCKEDGPQKWADIAKIRI